MSGSERRAVLPRERLACAHWPLAWNFSGRRRAPDLAVQPSEHLRAVRALTAGSKQDSYMPPPARSAAAARPTLLCSQASTCAPCVRASQEVGSFIHASKRGCVCPCMCSRSSCGLKPSAMSHCMLIAWKQGGAHSFIVSPAPPPSGPDLYIGCPEQAHILLTYKQRLLEEEARDIMMPFPHVPPGKPEKVHARGQTALARRTRGSSARRPLRA